MYYGNAPLPSLSHVPSWVDDLVRHYLPHDWRVVWHVVVPRDGETVSGCCRLDDHIIECFVSSSERKTCNEYLILHEISHALRGKIPKPPHRRNNVHHDEMFFRIAAKTYIDYNSTLEVLGYAAEHEYVTGRYVMAYALSFPKEFMANPLGIAMHRPIRKQRPAIVAGLIPDNTPAWFTRRTGEILVGKVLQARRKKYLFLDSKGKRWVVPFQLMKVGSPVQAAAAKLAELTKVAASS